MRGSLVPLVCLLASPLAAQDSGSGGGELPELLAREEEVALALSAAPEHLRAGAGVFVLEGRGYVQVRQSTNGFTCLVNRDHPRNQKPTCWDAEGTRAIVPVVLRTGELLMRGVPMEQIQQEIQSGFAEGRYRPTQRPGVAYMLSEKIRVYNPSTRRMGTFPPHVMFYAPALRNEDIGSDGSGRQGLPFIGYEGPHGYMIVVPPRPAGGSAATP
ncbi:MAG TPA: hypothetical protein VHG28_20425 [Longimicrobiaceae bacterium]|nr:hypothetical protein [Longimicrobiaceae bacterium]